MATTKCHSFTCKQLSQHCITPVLPWGEGLGGRVGHPPKGDIPMSSDNCLSLSEFYLLLPKILEFGSQIQSEVRSQKNDQQQLIICQLFTSRIHIAPFPNSFIKFSGYIVSILNNFY